MQHQASELQLIFQLTCSFQTRICAFIKLFLSENKKHVIISLKTTVIIKSITDQIQIIKKNNSSEIKIIEFDLKKFKFYRNQSFIIKYFQNYLNTETLCDIITALDSLFEKYTIL
jgi:hypothetical protein